MVDEQLDARGRPRSLYQTVNDGPELTVQSDAEDADIQKILKKYNAIGMNQMLDQVEATYQDVSAFEDYAEVMRYAKTAEQEFMKLPSKIRERFGHDVANWLDTAHDSEKRPPLPAESSEGPQPEPSDAPSPDPSD